MAAQTPTRDALTFPLTPRTALEPHLPPPNLSTQHATLTFAISLDSQLALSPGVQTALSGPDSKAMTHYLRSRHDAILIGVNTAVVDNPSLNCRLEGVGGYGGNGLEGQPRPVVVDPNLRWEFAKSDCKLLRLVEEGRGRAPWIVTGVRLEEIPLWKRSFLETKGGKFVFVEMEESGEGKKEMRWEAIFEALKKEGLVSVMVEGGAGVIKAILSDSKASEMVSSVIVTIAPVWLGEGGVQVLPTRTGGVESPVARLKEVKWIPLGEDVVLCGKLR